MINVDSSSEEEGDETRSQLSTHTHESNDRKRKTENGSDENSASSSSSTSSFKKRKLYQIQEIHSKGECFECPICLDGDLDIMVHIHDCGHNVCVSCFGHLENYTLSYLTHLFENTANSSITKLCETKFQQIRKLFMDTKSNANKAASCLKHLLSSEFHREKALIQKSMSQICGFNQCAYCRTRISNWGLIANSSKFANENDEEIAIERAHGKLVLARQITDKAHDVSTKKLFDDIRQLEYSINFLETQKTLLCKFFRGVVSVGNVALGEQINTFYTSNAEPRQDHRRPTTSSRRRRRQGNTGTNNNSNDDVAFNYISDSDIDDNDNNDDNDNDDDAYYDENNEDAYFVNQNDNDDETVLDDNNNESDNDDEDNEQQPQSQHTSTGRSTIDMARQRLQNLPILTRSRDAVPESGAETTLFPSTTTIQLPTISMAFFADQFNTNEGSLQSSTQFSPLLHTTSSIQQSLHTTSSGPRLLRTFSSTNPGLFTYSNIHSNDNHNNSLRTPSAYALLHDLFGEYLDRISANYTNTTTTTTTSASAPISTPITTTTTTTAVAHTAPSSSYSSSSASASYPISPSSVLNTDNYSVNDESTRHGYPSP